MAAEKIDGKINLDNFAGKQLLENGENLHHVEKAPDSSFEKPKTNEAQKIENTIQSPSVSTQAKISVSPVKSFQEKRALEIDNILSEGLHDVFLKMGPVRQKEFKAAGELTASKISLLLDKGKVKVAKIIDLIKAWLQLIPGVNKFFLEQEAKIKADKIMSIKDN
jgi:hypothetical protein